MKTLNYPLIVTIAGLLLGSAGRVQADTSSWSNDGIAASPKIRAMLDEQYKSRSAAPAQPPVTTTRSRAEIAASPKIQQMRSERPSAPVIVVSTETAGYRPTGPDGITASPKVRSQLDERRSVIEIAPLK